MFLQGRQLMILRCWLRLMLDAAIQADCCWSLRLLADEFSVSFKTVETVVWKKISRKRCVLLWVPRLLTDHPKCSRRPSPMKFAVYPNWDVCVCVNAYGDIF